MPADADFTIVGMSAYSGGNNTHTTMTLTKGGADTAMTRVAGADLAVKWQTVMLVHGRARHRHQQDAEMVVVRW